MQPSQEANKPLGAERAATLKSRGEAVPPEAARQSPPKPTYYGPYWSSWPEAHARGTAQAAAAPRQAHQPARVANDNYSRDQAFLEHKSATCGSRDAPGGVFEHAKFRIDDSYTHLSVTKRESPQITHFRKKRRGRTEKQKKLYYRVQRGR